MALNSGSKAINRAASTLIAFHRSVVAGDELSCDHPLQFVFRPDAD
jgi:hypothetical protein